ncbi:unnamed protein product [Medioppia subpectinata]|uniref:Cytochrome P450 n=1 Tax=Medioppia subpectinata TaxID=1979941 RepID=A0A7R9KT19_9ACAR|nr:unnamed protein product [Medioppia subpectinata]CAG2109332.1 unnamed protein product [Medioppia subpectinata]
MRFLSRKLNYWSVRGVNGPKPVPIFGNVLQLFVKPRPLVEKEWIHKYGKIYGYYVQNNPILTIAEPELIKLVLVKNFHLFADRRHEESSDPIIDNSLTNLLGDDWKRVRSIVSPTFSSGKMRKMYPMVRQCLTDFMDHLEVIVGDGEAVEIDVKQVFGNFTMDVITTCAFATKTNSHKELNNPFVVNAKRIFNISALQLISLIVLPNFALKWIESSPINTLQFLIKNVRQILAKRRLNKDGDKYNDFVQLMVDLHKDPHINDNAITDPNDVNEAHHLNEGAEELLVQKKALNTSNKYMSDTEILSQALMFLLAGYETTATALSASSYELALNPSVQQKLYEEITAAMDGDGEIGYEELAKLPFLDAFMSETLRIHSPAIRVSRLAATDFKLGDTGITIKKDQMIEVPVYAIHHCEDFYPNAEQFDPDRFMPHNRHKIIPYTYLPFGAGPRSCIGMRFALMEAKLGLAHIVSKYRFSACTHTDVPLNYKRDLKMTFPKRIVVAIEKRR